MEKKVQAIVDRAMKDRAFAANILKSPKSALASYDLSPNEVSKIMGLVKKAQTPPP